jgi:hypothetical protein
MRRARLRELSGTGSPVANPTDPLLSRGLSDGGSGAMHGHGVISCSHPRSSRYCHRSRALPRATCEEDPTCFREARARTGNPDFGSDSPRYSTGMNMGPSPRQRPVGEVIAEGVRPESPAHSARVADGRPLVAHAIASLQVPQRPADLRDGASSRARSSRSCHQPPGLFIGLAVAAPEPSHG